MAATASMDGKLDHGHLRSTVISEVCPLNLISCRQRRASLHIGDTVVSMDVVCQFFSDTIFLVATPEGRIGQLVELDLTTHRDQMSTTNTLNMLIPNNLEPKNLFGTIDNTKSTMQEIIAIHTASLVSTRQRSQATSLLMGVTLPGSVEFWEAQNPSVRNKFILGLLDVIGSLFPS